MGLNADPAIPPERRKAGNITHSVALINACKPFHWKDEFPPSNTPSPEIAKQGAREVRLAVEWQGAGVIAASLASYRALHIG